MAGEKIGRFPPPQAPSGRTEGNPCVGAFGLCEDRDVEAWLVEAKAWYALASRLRDGDPQTVDPTQGGVIFHFGPDPGAWPFIARVGQTAYVEAAKILNGDVGWLDGSQVKSYIQVQRLCKQAMEAWLQAIEQKLAISIDPGKLVNVLYDAAKDTNSIPPQWTPPPLSGLFGGFFKIAALAVGGYVLVQLVRGNSK